MRQVLELMIEGCRLVGTFHPPHQKDGANVGLLFLNSGFLPRAPVGDLTVHLADCFAARGLPAFRFDMPGLGDSDGTLPPDVQTFFSQVLSGLHGMTAAMLAQELARRFNLKGMILGGLCGGATTSLYAAACFKCEVISGLVLLDPSFVMVNAPPGPNPSKLDGKPLKTALKNKPQQLYQAWRVKVLQTQAGETARGAYHKIKPFLIRMKRFLTSFRSEPLPKEANRQFIDAMQEVCRRNLPMLVVLAGEDPQLTDQFDYLRYIVRNHGRAVSHHYLPGATHSFVEGNGEAMLIQLIQQWMKSWPEAEPATLAGRPAE